MSLRRRGGGNGTKVFATILNRLGYTISALPTRQFSFKSYPELILTLRLRSGCFGGPGVFQHGLQTNRKQKGFILIWFIWHLYQRMEGLGDQRIKETITNKTTHENYDKSNKQPRILTKMKPWYSENREVMVFDLLFWGFVRVLL